MTWRWNHLRNEAALILVSRVKGESTWLVRSSFLNACLFVCCTVGVRVACVAHRSISTDLSPLTKQPCTCGLLPADRNASASRDSCCPPPPLKLPRHQGTRSNLPAAIRNPLFFCSFDFEGTRMRSAEIFSSILVGIVEWNHKEVAWWTRKSVESIEDW